MYAWKHKKNQSHFHFYQLLSPKMIDKKKNHGKYNSHESKINNDKLILSSTQVKKKI
jgi:hypothetical protein